MANSKDDQGHPNKYLELPVDRSCQKKCSYAILFCYDLKENRSNVKVKMFSTNKEIFS